LLVSLISAVIFVAGASLSPTELVVELQQELLLLIPSLPFSTSDIRSWRGRNWVDGSKTGTSEFCLLRVQLISDSELESPPSNVNVLTVGRMVFSMF